TVTSVDVTHGISIPAFHVNAQLQPGKATTVAFDATETGMFEFRCSVICGSGHRDMLGAVEVQP
ncbi:MAG TPA: cytochrome c oxidase subunit II, partial [Candidatus Binatia bacterium]|nr:cytochrome c oxidase subunit II [Candidatus Binatia bacterium]